MKLADEAGFTSFHLAEHHGSGLCMAPTQEIFIAAASQVTKTIRLGPMVKLLPLHHPRADPRGHVRRRPAHRRPPRLRRRPRRRADRARVVRQQVDGVAGALRGHARHHLQRVRDAARSRAPAASTTTSRPIPLATKPFQDPIPFWYPGNPVVAGRHGMSLMCAGRRSAEHLRRLRRELGGAPRRHAPARRPRQPAAHRLAR